MSCAICEDDDYIFIKCNDIEICCYCMKKYLQKLIDDKYITAIILITIIKSMYLVSIICF